MDLLIRIVRGIFKMRGFIVVLLQIALTPVSWAETQEEVAARLKHLLPMVQKDPFSVGAIQKGWDQQDINQSVKEIEWLPQMIMRLTIRDFMSSTIKLPEWERIVHFELGEDENFVAKKVCSNILTLRSLYAGCDTNLTIVGKTGNIYTFYVRSISFQDKQLPDLTFIVLTNFGRDNKDIRRIALDDRNSIEVKEDIPFDPSRLHFDFFMSGDADIAPQTVYSDGLFTWLEYGVRWDAEDLPTVYHIKDAVESPVNTRVDGAKIVIEAVGNFVLKSGAKRVCIFAETEEHQ